MNVCIRFPIIDSDSAYSVDRSWALRGLFERRFGSVFFWLRVLSVQPQLSWRCGFCVHAKISLPAPQLSPNGSAWLNWYMIRPESSRNCAINFQLSGRVIKRYTCFSRHNWESTGPLFSAIRTKDNSPGNCSLCHYKTAKEIATRWYRTSIPLCFCRPNNYFPPPPPPRLGFCSRFFSFRFSLFWHYRVLLGGKPSVC